MKKQFMITVSILALALTGCVSGTSPKLSDSHPANPQAQASPVPPATPMLVAGAQGLVLPASTNEPGMHHEQTPANKATQKPAEHQHEHEQPMKEEKK
ncbi:MAG: hypothetical protein ABI651_09505 [Verrucomicrobiota bacterium]